jgi:SAM-dependent methyltransferase
VLIEEARWLGDQLQRLDPDRVYPLLDVGSSTATFRSLEQPWIDRSIFGPARAAKRTVKHLDAKAAPGVDIVGDLEDPATVAALARQEFRSVLCSNLLEHVPDPQRIARTLLELVPAGGYLFVSCPYRYPFHPDPIDTRFRPTPRELAELFPGTRIVAQAVVGDGTYLDQTRGAPGQFVRLLARLLLPFYKPANWRRAWTQVIHHVPWAFRRFEATCVVLVRAG